MIRAAKCQITGRIFILPNDAQSVAKKKNAYFTISRRAVGLAWRSSRSGLEAPGPSLKDRNALRAVTGALAKPVWILIRFDTCWR